MSSGYSEPDHPTPAEFLDPSVTDGAAPYDGTAGAPEQTDDPSLPAGSEDQFAPVYGVDETGVVVDPSDTYDPGPSSGEPVAPVEPAEEGSAIGNPGSAIGNPGSTQDPADEYNQPVGTGNPGSTPDGADLYNEPRASGNPGSTSDPADEYNQSRGSGNLGPQD